MWFTLDDAPAGGDVLEGFDKPLGHVTRRITLWLLQLRAEHVCLMLGLRSLMHTCNGHVCTLDISSLALGMFAYHYDGES